jgi:hypothetical protein
LEKRVYRVACWDTGIGIAAIYPVFTGILLKMPENAEPFTPTGDFCAQLKFKTVEKTYP